MSIPKDFARSVGMFFRVEPAELTSLDEWAEWLLSLRSGLCQVIERDGELVLVEIRRLVEVVDGRLRIEIYSDEHPPPHFHVKSLSLDASFAIDDCQLMSGGPSASDINTIRYWHRHAKPMLIDVWNSTRPGDCSVGECGHA
jgi:hypothetical protein